MKRASGVLLHISSLWGSYSCGSFGEAARQFVDFLEKGGFSYWQTLPFCLPDEWASPYSSYSTFSLNPDFIDLEELYKEGLISEKELHGALHKTPYSVEYDRLKEERMALLAKAAQRFSGGKEFEEFFVLHGHTEDFCHFMAGKAVNGQKPFWEWTEQEEDFSVYQTWRFVCYTFFRQWKKIKDYANEKGISIIGDIPMYVSLDSADVWKNPKDFQLDERFRPTRVAGVPPDCFSKDGQLWGNPLYDWKEMEKDGFSFWKDRICFMCALFDCIRIDHFRGLESYYAVDAKAENAREGKWEKGPGRKLLKALRSVCGEKVLIAEDLGIVTPAVERLVKDSGCPGMRVLQFGFEGGADSPHLPHNYPRNCVAYSGTHDNNTLLGYLWELGDDVRRRVFSYCGFEKEDWNCQESYRAVLHTLLGSPADVVILPLQDLLLYGADTRMNVPGRSGGNWLWRVTKEQVETVDTEWFLRQNRLFGRI